MVVTQFFFVTPHSTSCIALSNVTDHYFNLHCAIRRFFRWNITYLHCIICFESQMRKVDGKMVNDENTFIICIEQGNEYI